LMASSQTCSGWAALSVETLTFGITHLLGNAPGRHAVKL
jgi:hypothetical protein